MANKTPLRAVFNASDVATGLAEFQSGDTIPLLHGGIGVALSIGSAGQVLKVNSGASALEFGAVEAIVNIDNATNLTSATLATGDQILISDGGTEGRATLAQIDTLFSGTSKTLTNKTLTSPVINTGVSGTAILDEDNMASDSATQLSTQQSIKAYVDTELGNVSTTSIATGNSNVTVVDSGTGNVTIEVDGTDRITTVAATTTTATGHSLVMGAASSTVGGQIKFLEGTNNGTNGVTLQGPASTADVTVTLPAAADTLVGKATTDTLTNKTLTSPDINTPDIDGGTIDGATIATSDVTVGSGKTLNVSAGTLTTAAAQNLAIVQGVGANTDIGAFELRAATFESDIATGTAPLTIASTTKVANLNADLLDGMTTVDEDNMSSDSATSLPTQQSVKAYVDAQVTASDLDFQGDSGGALSIDLDSETLDIAGGTGVDTSGSSNTLTVAIDSTVTTLTGSQTLTNKILTAPVLSGSASAAGSILFKEDTDNGTNTVTLIGPASTADVIITLPAVTGTMITTANSDGAATTTSSSDADFVLVDDGGVMKKITTTNLGIVNSLGIEGSSFLTAPGTDGNFDLAKIEAQTGSAESGLTANAVDAFDIPTGSSPDQFDCMDPKFQTDTVDYGSGEAYAGA